MSFSKLSSVAVALGTALALAALFYPTALRRAAELTAEWQ